MRKRTNKCLLVAALAMGYASTSAAFNEFTVEEGVVTGAVANQIIADRIVGGYEEVVTFNNNGTFDTSIKVEIGQYFDGGSSQSSQLDCVTANCYAMYALFQASGTFVLNIGGDPTSGASFTFDSGGTLAVWIDEDQDTTLTRTNPGDSGALPWIVNDGGTPDVQVASGELQSGSGLLDPNLDTCGDNSTPPGGINCGSFGTQTTFALSAFGSTYFTVPDPFYDISFQSGQLDNFEVAGTQTIVGSADIVFDVEAIPEPSTLALMGLGMMGFGVMRRRKQD